MIKEILKRAIERGYEVPKLDAKGEMYSIIFRKEFLESFFGKGGSYGDICGLEESEHNVKCKDRDCRLKEWDGIEYHLDRMCYKIVTNEDPIKYLYEYLEGEGKCDNRLQRNKETV